MDTETRYYEVIRKIKKNKKTVFVINITQTVWALGRQPRNDQH